MARRRSFAERIAAAALAATLAFGSIAPSAAEIVETEVMTEYATETATEAYEEASVPEQETPAPETVQAAPEANAAESGLAEAVSVEEPTAPTEAHSEEVQADYPQEEASYEDGISFETEAETEDGRVLEYENSNQEAVAAGRAPKLAVRLTSEAKFSDGALAWIETLEGDELETVREDAEDWLDEYGIEPVLPLWIGILDPQGAEIPRLEKTEVRIDVTDAPDLADSYLFHRKNEGGWEEIAFASYEENGAKYVSFETDGFSPFLFVDLTLKEEDETQTPAEETQASESEADDGILIYETENTPAETEGGSEAASEEEQATESVVETETEEAAETEALSESESETETEALSEAETETEIESETTGELRALMANVNPGDDEDIEIRKFETSIRSGGSWTGKDYVWKTDDAYASGHSFIFRISYDVSGTYEFEPGEIKMTIPKSILVDRDGNPADTYQMSVPHRNESGLTEDQPYAYYEEGDDIVIINRTRVPAGQSGYVEIAYANSKSTFNYYDYGSADAPNAKGASNPFSADIVVKQGTQTKTAETKPMTVFINTNAKITSVRKKTPSFYSSWNKDWGDEVKPENPNDYYYLVWPVEVEVKNASQPYNLTFRDSFSGEGHLFLGYRDGYEDRTFKPSLTIENEMQNYPYARSGTDVLTAHLKSKYDGLENYSIPNSITVTLDPIDQVDSDSSASGSASYRYETPVFVHPKGHFYRWKWGLLRNTETEVKDSNYVSDYRLDLFKEGSEAGGIDVMNGIRYRTEIEGYPYQWTIADANGDGKVDAVDAGMPEAYGKIPVSYELIDDSTWLTQGRTPLTADDYQFDSLKIGLTVKTATFQSYDMAFHAYTTNPTTDDVITAYVKVNGGSEWIEAASFNAGRGAFESFNEEVVSAALGSVLNFKPGVTGYKLTTSNPYYYTSLNAHVTMRLFRTERVLKAVGDGTKLMVGNDMRAYSYDSKGNRLFSEKDYGFWYSAEAVRTSSIRKGFVKMSNDIKNRTVTAIWNVTVSERQQDYKGDSAPIRQESGRFYDLLPKGADYKLGSLVAKADGTELIEGQYEISLDENYKNTGRTMLTIDVTEPADYYEYSYSTLHSWDTIKDYGKELRNTVAYETGNGDIAYGSPDAGGDVKEKALMKDLDPDTDARKFLYAEATFSVSIPMSATVGLYKKVKGSTDGYSYSDTTRPDSPYSYMIRFSSDETSRVKDLIVYDSLENYKVASGVNAGAESDWRGTLVSVDASDAADKGAAPVVWYSTKENLNVDEDYDLTSGIWTKASEFEGSLSEVKAFAIDCRKTPSGSDYVLPKGTGMAFYVRMRSPKAVAGDKIDPVAYNNIYLNQTTIAEDGTEGEEGLIHQDFTRLYFRVSGDLKLYKGDGDDPVVPVKGAVYLLSGTSDYGTSVNMRIATNKKGEISFKDVYRGKYVLKEVETTPDYFLDDSSYEVVIDGAGDVFVNGKKIEDRLELTDKPRIHADMAISKRGRIDGVDASVPVEGVAFRLKGTSDYGTAVSVYAESNSGGEVRFGDLEKGTYSLEEVESAEGYVISEAKFTVKVDSFGEVTVTDDKTGEECAKDAIGSVIYNEPLHSLKIRKLDEKNKTPLSGAEYRLRGTSDLGTPTDLTATSNGDGVMTFEGLEPGNYVLTETAAPKHYVKAAKGIPVRINSDGSSEGLPSYSEINDAVEYEGFVYVTDERAYEGVVEITKVWEGDVKPGKAYRVDVFDKDGNELEGPFDGYKTAGTQTATAHSSNVDDEGNKIEDYENYSLHKSSVVIPGATVIHLSVDYSNPRGQFYVWQGANEAALNSLYANGGSIGGFSQYLNASTAVKTLTAVNNQGDGLLHEEFDVQGNSFSVAFLSYAFTPEMEAYTDLADYGYYITAVGELGYEEVPVSSGDVIRLADGQRFEIRNLPEGATFKLTEVADETDRPFPVVKISTKDPESSSSRAVLDLNTLKNKIGYNSYGRAQGFRKADISSVEEVPKGAMIVSDIYNTEAYGPEEALPTFAWFDPQTNELLWWSAADAVYLVTEGGNGFSSWTGLKEVDFSGLRGDRLDANSLQYLFNGCSTLKKIRFGSLDTSNCRNAEYIFNGCSSLTDVDFYNMDMQNVTNLYSAFGRCTSFTNLDLSVWDIKSLRRFDWVFTGCSNLRTLDLHGWDTSRVYYLYTAITQVPNLEVIDLSGWTFDSVTEIERFAYSNPSLKTVYASQHMVDATIRSDATYPFYNDKALQSNYGTGLGDDKYLYNTGKEKFMRLDGYDDDYNFNPEYIGKGWLTAKDVPTPIPEDEKPSGYVVISPDKSPGKKIIGFMKSPLSSFEEVQEAAGDGLKRFDDRTTKEKAWCWIQDEILYWWSDAETVYLPEDCSGFVQRLYNYAHYYLMFVNLDGLDGSRVKKADGFFNVYWESTGSWSSSTTFNSIEFGSCRMDNLESADGMFASVGTCQDLDLSAVSIDGLTSLHGMFAASHIESIDLSGWDVSKITDFGEMFKNSRYMTELNLSGWDMKSGETAAGMLTETYLYNSNKTPKYKLILNDFNPNGLDMGIPSGTWRRTEDGKTVNLNELTLKFSEDDCGTYEYVTETETETTPAAPVYGHLYEDGTYVISDSQEADASRGNLLDTRKYSGSVRVNYYASYDGTQYSKLVKKLAVECPVNGSSEFCDYLNALEEVEGMENVTFKGSSPSQMFAGCPNLRKISGTPKLVEPTSLHNAFYGCRLLEEIDVSGWDVSKVTSFSGAFTECSSLTELDVSEWDVSEPTEFSNMFRGCSSLTELDVSGWNVSKATGFTNMFSECSSLKELDLSAWNPENGERFSGMFQNCSSLERIYASSHWTRALTTNESLFSGCSSLATDKGTEWKDGMTGGTYARLDGFDSGYNESAAKIGKGLFTAKNQPEPDGNPEAAAENSATIDAEKWKSARSPFIGSAVGFMKSDVPMTEIPEDAARVDTEETDFAVYTWLDEESKIQYWQSDADAVYLPENSSSLFDPFPYAESIDMTGLDSSRVENFYGMFKNCLVAKTIDVSELNTSNGINFSYMFQNCKELESVDLSGFDTSSAVDMSYMFQVCSKLKEIDVSGFDVSNVLKTEGMFNVCPELTELDLSSWNPAKLKYIGSMFVGSTKIKRIYASEDLYKGNGLTSGYGPFSGCTELSTNIGHDVINLGTDIIYAVIDGTRGDNGKIKKGLLTYKSKDGDVSEPADESDGGDVQTSKSVMYEGSAEDSANAYEQWIDNGDGTWTYRFKVFDSDAAYYAWETDAPGYRWDEDFLHAVRIDYTEGSEDAGAAVTNRKNPDEEVGHLAATKILEGNQLTAEDLAREYSFTATIEGLPDGKYGSVEFKDGVGTFTLKGGQTIYVTGLPADLAYEIEEEDLGDGFETSYSGKTGTTEASVVKKIKVTNVRKDWYGSLKVGKTLTSGEEGVLFPFRITLSGDGLEGTRTFGSLAFKDGVCDVSIPSGTYVEATGIPAGTEYSVTELEKEGYVQKSAEGATGTIVATETAEATFENEKLETPRNGFSVRKKVTGPNMDEKFNFSVILNGLEKNAPYVLSDGTKFTSTAKGTARVRLSLGDGESATFEGLPIGTEYSVTEDANGCKASYSITNSGDAGSVARSSGANGTVNKALSTAAETVDEGETIEILFENEIPTFFAPVMKFDEEGNILGGAVLSIVNEEGKTVHSWTTSDVDSYEAKLEKGKYVLKEESAPDGYVVSAPIEFEVTEDGEILVDGEPVSTVEMTDPATTASFSKLDGDGNALKGASLAVYEGAAVADDGTVSDDAEPVAAWTSGKTPKKLTGILKAEGEYVLVELSAPYGYSKAEPIRFTVPADGSEASVEMTDILVAREAKVLKTDKDGRALAGASLMILDAATEARVTDFVTTESEKVLNLLPGSYLLRETAVPDADAYRIADDIAFEIAEDGSVKIGGKTVEDGIIRMIDYDLKNEVKIVKKDVEGNGISGASLRISGTANDGSAFDDVEMQSSKDGNSVELKAGSYVLHEDAAPGAFEKAGDVAFKVNVDGTVEIDGEPVDEVVMIDEYKKHEVKIRKKKENDDPLEGAKLTLSGKEVGRKDGIEAVSWTTDAAGEKTLELRPGEYSVHEDSAPEGFNTAEDVRFRISTDGQIFLISSDGTETAVSVVSMTDGHKTGNLKVSKKVEGDMGDKTKQFSFTLKLTIGTVAPLPESIDYEKNGEKGTASLNRNGEASFTLSHGDEIEFMNVPYGTKYEVSEIDAEADGYEVSSTGESGTMTENGASAEFVNRKGGIVSTSADFGGKGAGMLAAAILIAAMTFIFRRRRRTA